MRTSPSKRPAIGLLVLLLLAPTSFSAALSQGKPARIAVLGFGESQTGWRVADQIAAAMAGSAALRKEFQIIDRDLARAAAAGIGYRGSLNMPLEEARDLGAAIGCDFFFTGVAETLRRSPSEGPSYFESYAAIYVVSSRTGRLVFWERLSARSPAEESAERALLDKVSEAGALFLYRRQIVRAVEDEHVERARAVESPPPVIEEAPDYTVSTTNGLRLPRPYRRLKPPYPEEAARAEVEATVDALVDIDAQGEVGRVEVVRWAGYGLDQSVIDTVKQLHFFPAQRDGERIPIRVLLRYNFRKPPRDDKTGSGARP